MNEQSNKMGALSHADKTLRGLRQVATARIFTQLVTWGLTVITIHLLQPADYGLIATAGIFTSFALLLLDGGLSDVLVAQRELSEQLQGAAATTVLLISSVLGALIFLAAPFASSFFHAPQLRLIIEVTAFYLPLVSLDVAPLAVLSKRMQFKQIARAQTLGSVLNGLSTLSLAYAGFGYWSLIIGNFVGTSLRISLLWLSLDTKPVPNFQVAALRPLIRNSGHMLGQRLTYFSIDNFDLFILGRFGGPTVVGPYSVSRNLSHSALNQIAGIVNQVSVSAFAAKTAASEQLRGLTLLVSLAAAILFPLFWMMGIVSQIALPLVFGAKWIKLVVPFIAFTTILPLRGIYTLLNSSVVGTGRTGTMFRNTLSWAAIIMPLMLLGVTQGADGVALSWTVGFPIVFYFGARRLAHEFSTGVSTLLRPMAAPAACAGTSSLAAESLRWLLPEHFAPAIVLGCQCCLGGSLYWLLYRIFAPAQYAQTFAIARRLVGA